jgi:hypothetical protein
MSIKRAPRPKTNFTIITNAVLRDENLSFRARGVLACILSRPDNWKTTAESLARESKEGRSAILTVLKELEVAGYMKRTKYRNEKGQWVWESFVYDSPQHNHKPESNYPPTDKPTSGEPSTEIQTLIEEPIKNERKEEVTTRTYGDEITQLSNLLADLIEANGIKRPDVTDKWHQEIERLNRLDGYSYEQIEQTIRWVQQDSFWRSNVLSPAKLRKQFGALQLKMKSSGSGLSGWANVINKLSNQSKELGQ